MIVKPNPHVNTLQLKSRVGVCTGDVGSGCIVVQHGATPYLLMERSHTSGASSGIPLHSLLWTHREHRFDSTPGFTIKRRIGAEGQHDERTVRLERLSERTRTLGAYRVGVEVQQGERAVHLERSGERPCALVANRVEAQQQYGESGVDLECLWVRF